MSNIDIPYVPFEALSNRIKYYWNPLEYNPHKGLFAPTRSGKSYLIRHGLLSIVPNSRTVLIDVKPGGEPTWHGWGNQVEELKHGFARGSDGTYNYRVMLKPNRDEGKEQVQRILDMILAEGETILVMDDSRKITAHTPQLGMSNHVDELITDGAGIGISVILAANSTTWATPTLRDGCGIYFMGHATNEEQRAAYSKVIGLPKQYQPALSSLGRRQFLYSDQYDGELRLAITTAPQGAIRYGTN